MPGIRYEAALAAATEVLSLAGAEPVPPELLARATYAVLETLYAVELHLARQCPGGDRSQQDYVANRRKPG